MAVEAEARLLAVRIRGQRALARLAGRGPEFGRAETVPACHQQVEAALACLPDDAACIRPISGDVEDADRVLKATDAVGFVGASSLERMGVEDSLTQLTRRFKAIKAPAAKSFGKAAKKK